MFKALILFGQFFTKLPLPFAIPDATNRFRRNIQYLTLFGFILGATEAVIFWGLTFVFPVWLAWGSYWIIDGIITGGFHLDALADTADGFFSSRTPDKIFKIMKDSRLGTMGSLALIYYYFLVVGLGISLSSKLSIWHLALLVATLTMMTKAGLSLLFYKMKYVGTPHGLSLIWLDVATWQIVIAQVISLVIVGVIFSWAGILAYLGVFLTARGYRWKVTKVLGGFSGDTLGAFATLSPLIFLIILTVIVRLGGWS